MPISQPQFAKQLILGDWAFFILLLSNIALYHDFQVVLRFDIQFLVQKFRAVLK